jgi:predicted nuclease with TOPRIM domain
MEGTYEYELERAELLGVDPISREQWEEQVKARKEVELEQEQTEIAGELEAEDEKLKGTHGKMDELNSILSATQFKLNKFKVRLSDLSKAFQNK